MGESRLLERENPKADIVYKTELRCKMILIDLKNCVIRLQQLATGQEM